MSTIYNADDATSSRARLELERRYESILCPTGRFNRRLVSYQANKAASLHRWFKYKEGFSAQLVRQLAREFDLSPPQHILDPFAGVSTTLLVAQELGLGAAGIELMPFGEIVWRAKSKPWEYSVSQLKLIREWVASTSPKKSNRAFPHLPITRHAFDPEQEAQFMWYDERFEVLDVDQNVKTLLKFVLLSILEDISYTSKDGQFLRWDTRSGKMRIRNENRVAAGRKPAKDFYKREILGVQPALIQALDLVIHDISMSVSPAHTLAQSSLTVGTVLESLPCHRSGSFDAVITSPPYCNRYDYTRTYALELAYVGIDQVAMRDLRQQLLSCTVENRSKVKHLRHFYQRLGRIADFEHITKTVAGQEAFQEVLSALRTRRQRGEMNNRGVISMVEGYFTEMAFVTFELVRVCKTGARVAVVNDNVRYSGEIIPVDLMMSELAESFGFTPEKVYVLPQRKGNSSQQMGKYGREALRKSILIWRKR